MWWINHHFHSNVSHQEEDKNFTGKEMKCSCYLGILKEGFSAYFCSVMLISWKVTKDKSGNRF